MKNLNIFLSTIFIIICASVQAQIPRTLSYQGVLTDQAGNSKEDDSYSFIFTLYDSSVGGNQIWTETKTLEVKKGLFSTALGDVEPFGASVRFDKPYWLGIQVGNEPELSPRIPLMSVGYSLNAVRADTAKVAVASLADTTWKHRGPDIYRVNGNIGIGTINPISKLHVHRAGNAWIDITSSDAIGSYTRLGSVISNGIKESQLQFNNTFRFVAPLQGNWIMTLNETGNVGIGTTQPNAKLEVIGGPAWTSLGWKKSLKFGNVSSMEFDIATNLKYGIGASSFGNNLCFFSTTTEGVDAPPKYIMLVNNDGLEVIGRTKTHVLEITGADFAEPFEISNTDSLPLGSLVVIDPDNPGNLKQAVEPYDKRVAGVISGAGGIYPGIMVTKDDKLKNSQYVAMAGKVYALATADNGAIEPGDLLTTSETPGHAMKATDKERWSGAVIGKAMSGLEQGEGLVLVLVQPQ